MSLEERVQVIWNECRSFEENECVSLETSAGHWERVQVITNECISLETSAGY